jgi:hypothetical protein
MAEYPFKSLPTTINIMGRRKKIQEKKRKEKKRKEK